MAMKKTKTPITGAIGGAVTGGVAKKMNKTATPMKMKKTRTPLKPTSGAMGGTSGNIASNTAKKRY